MSFRIQKYKNVHTSSWETLGTWGVDKCLWPAWRKDLHECPSAAGIPPADLTTSKKSATSHT